MALTEALEQDARAILARASLPCSVIIAVDRDSILYVNAQGKARTAWLDVRRDGHVNVEMATGFQADPPAGWHGAPRPLTYGLAAQSTPESG